MEALLKSAPLVPAHSTRLFVPLRGSLVPRTHNGSTPQLTACARNVASELQKLITQKNYPCVAALSSLRNEEFQVGLYDELGSDKLAFELACDLHGFLNELELTKLPYLTFFAVFPEPAGEDMDEAEFEARLWRHLSHLSRVREFQAPWDPRCSPNPSDQQFGFSFGGMALFVVGLHRNSSRLSRRFPYPTLIFNAFEQFDSLMREGRYQPMVDTNRARDKKFQGSVNPMAARYGETWESIQFSGRANSANWKCPFRH